MSDAVTSYYATFDEWARLDAPAGRIEFERSLDHVLSRISAGSDVLDVGGGPGRYTIALAEHGHRVWLVDPSEALVRQASERIEAAGLTERVPAATVGDARDLTRFSDEAFDAILALGPFYHLVEEADRRRAADELFRTLRPGALAFVSFLPRLSGLAGLIARAAADREQVPPSSLSRVISDGVFSNPTDRGFQDGFYPELSEIDELFSSAGFERIDLFSIRGLAFGAEAEFSEIVAGPDPEAASFRDLVEATCRDARVIELCGHAMLTIRRPATRRS